MHTSPKEKRKIEELWNWRPVWCRIGYRYNGNKLLKKVVDNLIIADKIGDEMYLSFVNKRLIKGKANVFDTMKKVNLDIELKKTKKVRKAVSVMKGDRQALWGNTGWRSEPWRCVSVAC